jgi:soluble lytic murein transglycosylase-like protein
MTRYEGPPDEDFTRWALLRKGLLAYLGKDWSTASSAFARLAEVAPDAATRSQAWYWRGRALAPLARPAEAREALQRAGTEDPLSYYDILAGQLLETPSGLASTRNVSPFERPWREIQERWIRMRVGRPFALFRPELWFEDDSPGADAPAPLGAAGSPTDAGLEEASRGRRRAFENSVSSSLLLATALRAGLGAENFEQYTAHLRDSGSLLTRLLRSEALWAKQSYGAFFGGGKSHFPSAVRIAWLLHVLGDYRNAMPFVASFKSDLMGEQEDLAFLYFIFYPKPYVSAFTDAAQRCGVDSDLLYALARQESLYQPEAVSPAGAMGLMQVLPATAARALARLQLPRSDGRNESTRLTTPEQLLDPATNLLAGACHMRHLLDRYRGDLVRAVAAYNAGEQAVDTWLARRDKIPDPPFFVEWIPYQETSDYVQKVLRNFHNLKWIYGTR